MSARKHDRKAPDASPPPGRPWGYIVGVYALALGLRLLFVYQSHAYADFHTPTPGLDISMHWEGAKHIRAGTPDPCFELMPPSAPFHPYFVAFCQTFLGENLLAHRVFRAFLCSFSSVFIFLIVRRLTARNWAGLAAGIFAATLHSWIYYDTMLIKAGPEIFLFCLSLCIALHAPVRGRWWIFALTGTLLGIFLSIMRFSQGGTTLFFIAIALYFVFRRDLPSWTARAGLIVPMVILVMGTNQAFKHREQWFGIPATRFLPVSGVHVRIGFQEGAIGTYHVLKRFPALPLGHTYFARMAAEARAGRPLTAAEANQSYLDEARTFVKMHPGETVRILLRKLGLFVNNLEPAGNHYLPHIAKRVPVLHIPQLGYGGIFALSVWGFVALRKARKRAPTILLGGLILAVLLINLVSFVTARYRLPATVPFLILSGCGLPFLWNELRALFGYDITRQQKTVRVCIFAVVTGTAVWAGFRTVLPNARGMMMITAERNKKLSVKAGKVDREIERMESIDRRNARQQLEISTLYHMQGRYTDSFKALQAVARETPDMIPITRQYLVFMMWYGDYDFVIDYMAAVRNQRPETFKKLLDSFNSDSKFWMGGDTNLRLIVQALMRDFILPELRKKASQGAE